jgi:hypothetical protein
VRLYGAGTGEDMTKGAYAVGSNRRVALPPSAIGVEQDVDLRRGESQTQTRRGAARRSGMPHVGPTAGRCNFCGIRLDSASRGRTCPSSPQGLTGGSAAETIKPASTKGDSMKEKA